MGLVPSLEEEETPKHSLSLPSSLSLSSSSPYHMRIEQEGGCLQARRKVLTKN